MNGYSADPATGKEATTESVGSFVSKSKVKNQAPTEGDMVVDMTRS